jgi:hypothetical protein
LDGGWVVQNHDVALELPAGLGVHLRRDHHHALANLEEFFWIQALRFYMFTRKMKLMSFSLSVLCAVQHVIGSTYNQVRTQLKILQSIQNVPSFAQPQSKRLLPFTWKAASAENRT